MLREKYRRNMSCKMQSSVGLIYKYLMGRGEGKQSEWDWLRLPQASTQTLMRHPKDNNRMRKGSVVRPAARTRPCLGS